MKEKNIHNKVDPRLNFQSKRSERILTCMTRSAKGHSYPMYWENAGESSLPLEEATLMPTRRQDMTSIPRMAVSIE